MDNQQASVKKNAINYGLILGGVLVLVITLVYALSLESLTNFWLGVLIFLFIIIMGIISTAKSKAILGGFMTFKQAFSSYFITIAVGLFMYVLVQILIFSIIDQGAAEYLNEQALERTRETLEWFGTPEEVIQESLAKAAEQNNFSLGNQLLSYAIQVVFYSVFGLLVALIMKRKDPNAID